MSCYITLLAPLFLFFQDVTFFGIYNSEHLQYVMENITKKILKSEIADHVLPSK